MNQAALVIVLLLVAVTSTAVVLNRDPGRQAMVFSAYGVLLTILMLALAAPDVALSQLGVGVVLSPLISVLTIARCRREIRRHHEQRAADSKGQDAA